MHYKRGNAWKEAVVLGALHACRLGALHALRWSYVCACLEAAVLVALHARRLRCSCAINKPQAGTKRARRELTDLKLSQRSWLPSAVVKGTRAGLGGRIGGACPS